MAYGPIYSGTVELENGTVVVAANAATGSGTEIRGAIRTSVAATLRIWQNPVTYTEDDEEVVDWLILEDVEVTSSEDEGTGEPVQVDLNGSGGVKVELIAGATGTAYLDLYVKA